MSLRLAHLDPNEPRASKDCRTCNRRRIKCDRSLPTCRKCSIKSLECPGYGLRIRWDVGVASRGKLSGKALPIENSPTIVPGDKIGGSNQVSKDGSSPLPPQLWIPPSLPASSSSPSGPATLPSPPYPTRVDVQSLLSPPLEPNYASLGISLKTDPFSDHELVNGGFTLQNPHALSIDLDTQPLSSPLQDPAARILLEYYNHVVAPLFDWVEGPENDWRTVMIPLALECKSLLLALLALAAEHYESKTGSQWVFQDSRGTTKLRGECLQILARDLNLEMGDMKSPEDRRRGSGILATILALCNLEMVRADSDLWHIHWSAARAITDRWTSPPRSPTSLDYNCRFLVLDAFTYDAFASTTTFDGNDPIACDAMHPDDVDIFVDYFRLIQYITRSERSRYHTGTGCTLPAFLQDQDTIREEFERVRLRNKGIDELFQLASEARKHDFNMVVDMYHFAGILYGCQTLSESYDTDLERRKCAENVIESYKQIGSTDGITQNFVWPLFIIGTEARGFESIQQYVEHEMLNAMRATGFGNCYAALEFLARWWKTSRSDWSTWTDFAREESKKGFRFLVI